MNRPQYGFVGKTVVITGGARGQGLSHAVAFAEAGANVVVWDITRREIPTVPYGLSSAREFDAAIKALAGKTENALVLDVDVTDEAGVAEAVASTVRRFKQIDVLINNAGVNSIAPVTEMSVETWDTVINVNLKGTFLCTKHVGKVMQEQGGGRIVNIASAAAMVGVPNQAHYVAAKHGVIGLTRALAVELGPFNIAVNAVCPTLVASPQSVGLSKVNPVNIADENKVGMKYVLPRMSCLQPRDVTEGVLWLASDSARFVTGTSLVIDGGFLSK